MGTVEVVHLGRPLGAAGESLLARSLSSALHEELRVRDVVFDPEPMTAKRLDGIAWLSRASDAVSRLRALPEGAPLFACIDVPTGRDVNAAADALHGTAVFQDPRVVITTGDAWSLRWSTTACTSSSDAAASDAGDAGDAGGSGDADAAPLPR